MNGILETKEAIEKIFDVVNELKETATVNRNNIEHIQNNIVDIKSDIEEIKSVSNNVQIRTGEMEVEMKSKVDTKDFEKNKAELNNLLSNFDNHKESGEKKAFFVSGQIIYLICTILGVGVAIALAVIK